MIAALKAKETKKLSVYRNLLAQIKNLEIDKKEQLTDGEIVALIKKQIKNLEEANALFAKGGRNDLVSENQTEISLLKQYLPAEISEGELTEKVRTIVNQNAQETNIGKLIGICIKELKGIADTSRIASTVKKLKS